LYKEGLGIFDVLHVTCLGVGCIVGIGITGTIVSMYVGISVVGGLLVCCSVGLSMGCFVGTGVFGTTKCDPRCAVGTSVKGWFHGWELGMVAGPSFTGIDVFCVIGTVVDGTTKGDLKGAIEAPVKI